MLEQGDYVGSPLREHTLNRRGSTRPFGTEDSGEATHIYVGYRSAPDSSATSKATWLDEAGQR